MVSATLRFAVGWKPMVHVRACGDILAMGSDRPVHRGHPCSPALKSADKTGMTKLCSGKKSVRPPGMKRNRI